MISQNDLLARIEIVNRGVVYEELDAIVNAANTSLLGGGGVDGAIHRAAGPELRKECQQLGGCPVGEARLTRGYNLPSRYIIHTVGPVYHDGQQGESELLASCYRHSLTLALDNDIRTVAFPCISTGAYGYPLQEATEIALSTVREILIQHPVLDLIRFCCFTEPEFTTYTSVLKKLQEQ
jgi:O-acetyl-ADP-ribose deacetylase (regulator of RNase III)